MLIEVKRDIATELTTTSKIMIEKELLCYGLEDTVREKFLNNKWTWREEYKIKGKTAIPSGKYQVLIDYSSHFQKELPHILDVPDFSGIRIHPGNTEIDTEGCLLPGKGRGADFVSYSRPAFNELFHRIRQAIEHGVKVMIRFENCFVPIKDLHY